MKKNDFALNVRVPKVFHEVLRLVMDRRHMVPEPTEAAMWRLALCEGLKVLDGGSKGVLASSITRAREAARP